MILEVFEHEEPNGNDRVQFTGTQRAINIEVTNDWYGDSDSGFGATLSVKMDLATAKKFSDWLIGYLAQVKP